MIVGSNDYFSSYIESCKTAFSRDRFNQSSSRAGRAVHRFAIRILKALHFKNYDKLADKRLQHLKAFTDEFQQTLKQFKMPPHLGTEKEELFKEWKDNMLLRGETLAQHHPEKNLQKPDGILFTHWALRSALRIAKSLKRDAKAQRLEHSFLNFVAEKQGKLDKKFATLSLKKKIASVQGYQSPAFPPKKNPSIEVPKPERFSIVVADDDGNCLFHSLQMGLNVEQSVTQFRIAVYQFMRDHVDKYAETIKNVLLSDMWDCVKTEKNIVVATASLAHNLREQFTKFYEESATDEAVSHWIENEGVNAYLEGMGAEGCKAYAGSPELQAISDCFKRPIRVDSNDFPPMVYGENYQAEPIYLKLAHKHYNLMVKKPSQ